MLFCDGLDYLSGFPAGTGVLWKDKVDWKNDYNPFSW